MKVLYIGNYRDGTGWSEAAINFILSLDSVGIEVCCRPIKLNNIIGDVPDRINQLENKSSESYDICIQHVLPHMLVYDGGFKKNVAMYATETLSFNASSWSTHINMMDAAIVFSEDSLSASKHSGVNIPLYITPHADNTDKYLKKYEKFKFNNHIDQTFKFYWIGEINERKNLEVLLKAFHLTFEKWENVSLIIKTTNKSQQELGEICNNVKRNLKLYPKLEDYHQEILITGYMDEPTLMSLHNACDVFVCPSSGEAWSYPSFTALSFGKQIVAPQTGGFEHYLNNNNAYLVDTELDICYGETNTFFDLFNGYDRWQPVKLDSLRKNLRGSYTLPPKCNNINIFDFNHRAVGLKLKKILEEILNG